MTLEDIYGDVRFERYFALLSEWNNKFNLTAVTERKDVFLKHFYDSVLPLSIALPLFKEGARILDVGSGAGFPGVCLKLARPDLDVTLVESVGKKVLFLDALLSELKLTGIRVLKTRVEDFKQKDFNHAVARAVAPISTLAEYCLPFLKIGGSCVFYKSAVVENELSAASRSISFLGGKVENVLFAQLSTEILRSFVVVRKFAKTPLGYPRGGNKPKLEPL
ncbi:MAG: 16S rRNA (guanine(527)-N(7))-methyltransferase RsmG [Firmicutes bacterium]|nr:16S rRNA (guanine(527)-N(7))-methyltransferase RsmG [Bacillota bacterium]